MAMVFIMVRYIMIFEYEHGEDFCLVENICIHVFLVLIYAEMGIQNLLWI